MRLSTAACMIRREAITGVELGLPYDESPASCSITCLLDSDPGKFRSPGLVDASVDHPVYFLQALSIQNLQKSDLDMRTLRSWETKFGLFLFTADGKHLTRSSANICNKAEVIRDRIGLCPQLFLQNYFVETLLTSIQASLANPEFVSDQSI